jgi:hypothetical protein
MKQSINFIYLLKDLRVSVSSDSKEQIDKNVFKNVFEKYNSEVINLVAGEIHFVIYQAFVLNHEIYYE